MTKTLQILKKHYKTPQKNFEKKCFSDLVSFFWNAGTPERSKISSPFRRSGVPEEAQGSQSSPFRRSRVPEEAQGS